jgi:hypothetical protein
MCTHNMSTWFGFKIGCDSHLHLDLVHGRRARDDPELKTMTAMRGSKGPIGGSGGGGEGRACRNREPSEVCTLSVPSDVEERDLDCQLLGSAKASLPTQG